MWKVVESGLNCLAFPTFLAGFFLFLHSSFHAENGRYAIYCCFTCCKHLFLFGKRYIVFVLSVFPGYIFNDLYYVRPICSSSFFAVFLLLLLPLSSPLWLSDSFVYSLSLLARLVDNLARECEHEAMLFRAKAFSKYSARARAHHAHPRISGLWIGMMFKRRARRR